MLGQPLKSNKMNFILRGHSYDVDPALKQCCATVTGARYTVYIYYNLMNHTVWEEI